MTEEPVLALLNRLGRPAERAEIARALAERLGAESLVFFVKDEALGVMLPAPGMPKTVSGGPLWRAFLARCLRERCFSGMIDSPAGAQRVAMAVVVDGTAAVLAGGRPEPAAAQVLELHLPLLAALLHAEQRLLIGSAEAAAARDTATRANALAQSLDASRAAGAELNLKLRREHERKDEFLAMLAHELRNPLAPLVNSIEVLRQGGSVRDQPGLRQLDLMSRQLHQLTRLVEDLLDVSRVSRGLIELQRSALPLDSVLDEAVDLARPTIDGKRHTLQRSGAGGDLYVNGDRVRLAQVFANLLQNAAKYTDPGGRISIDVVADSGRASVVVRDTGVGIPGDMLSRVFDLFAQVPGTLDRSQGGLGIGLTLVRTLVELHGGHVSAHSVGKGRGSTFTVSLPLVRAPHSRPADPAPARAELREGRGLRVLVVDDNKDGADSLADLLRFMGADAVVAHDGMAALQAAADATPALIFLDIGLPGMDGYETARRLRASPLCSRVRLVALTGYGGAQDQERALQAGFDAHLVKPAPPAVIRDMLDELGAMHATS